MLKNTWLRWLGAVLVIACVAVPAHALERGVYLVDGTNDYYFVDEFGSRHVIQDFDAVKTRWFTDTPVVTTKVDVINALPLGDVITTTVGPDMVVKKTKTTTTTSVSTDAKLSSGLYRASGSGDIYFVDENGVRHLVNSYSTVGPRWFSNMSIVDVDLARIDALPLGDPITETVGPDTVIKKTTTTKTVETEETR